MGLVLVPIKEGQFEAWKSWSGSLSGDAKQSFDDLNKRFGLSRHDGWHAETTRGSVAVVLHEDPGAESFMQKLADSEIAYDVNFRNCIQEFHGINLKEPIAGPMPVKMT